MSFQFDFMSDDNEQSQSNDLVLELQPEIGQAQAIVVIDSSSLINSSNTVFKSISLKNDLVIQIIEDRTYSDINTLSIVDGVYEGGGELWECSVDLANYLLDKFSVNKTLPLSFLELGCGFGLPGLVACKSNISTVWMSDYNVDVIQKITLPNIVANNSTEQCRCIAGDWIDMIAYFQTKDNSIAFDVIVGAEVTYSIESTEKAILVLKELLTENGVGIFATKRFYFGVDGGSYQIEKYAKKYGLVATTCQSFEDGKSNIRDIIEIKRCSKPQA